MVPASDSILLPAGTLLGDTYEIEATLGKPGGFGITYLARDRHLDMRVAVKEFFPTSFARRRADGKTLVPVTHDHAEAFALGRQRFVDEARMLARFHHPNIVRVRTFFEENGTGYLVMDYLEGRTLASHLVRAGGRVSAETALAIARPLLSALQTLHAQNVVHRDLDPNNIYITNAQEVVLLDFGAARQAQVAGDTRSLSVVLKPGYAPYEQYASRGRQGPWTDLYALSATLYRMLVGHPPPEALSRLDHDDLVPVEAAVREAFGEELPPHVAQIINQGLRVRPEERPQSAEAFAQALLTAPAKKAVPEWIPPTPYRSSAQMEADARAEGTGRRRMLWALMVPLTLAAAGALWWGFVRERASAQQPLTQNLVGVVQGFGIANHTLVIDSTAYAMAAETEWPEVVAEGDSVAFTATGTVISALTRIGSTRRAAGSAYPVRRRRGHVTTLRSGGRYVTLDGRMFQIEQDSSRRLGLAAGDRVEYYTQGPRLLGIRKVR